MISYGEALEVVKQVYGVNELDNVPEEVLVTIDDYIEAAKSVKLSWINKDTVIGLIITKDVLRRYSKDSAFYIKGGPLETA